MAACIFSFIVVACWQAYRSQDQNGKHDLIMKYQEKGGIRNLGWVATYLESSETLNQEKATNKKGFVTRDAILSLNGFSVGVNLSTYYYIHSEVQDEVTAGKRTIFQQATDLKQAGLQKMLEEGSMGQVEIKIENPEKVEAKNQAKVLKSGQDRLEKEIGLLKNLLCHGEELQKKQPELEKIVSEGQKHLQEVQTFVEVVRKKLSIVSGMDKGTHDGEDWQKMLDDLKQHCAFAAVHLEGMKSFRVRLSALVQV